MDSKKGLIIINLGSPDSYSVNDVKTYLNEFLMDERVIDYPFILRKLLVGGVIVPFRVKKSAEAYKKVWTDKGSPLKVISNDFKNLVEQKVNMPVVLAMRYGNPDPASAIKELKSKAPNLEEILIAPMYPHYAMSSYETAAEYVKKNLGSSKNIRIRVLKPFYNDSAYINSLAESIHPHIEKNNFDAILFSYHGLPIRHIKKGDPTHNHCYASNDCCEVKSAAWDLCYRHQVKLTTRLVTKKLRIEESKLKLSFQSRLGSEKWMQPFTDVMLQQFPSEGIKKLLVVCPAFVADCLETLEEINIRGKETFMNNGGAEFTYIPCMNTDTKWVDTFSAYCNENETQYAHLWA